MEKLAMPSYEVIKRLTDMASGDLSKYLNEDGSIDINAMKADGMGYLLKKYKRVKRTLTAKGIPIGEEEYLDVELYPADGALDKLMRYHSLYNDKTILDLPRELLDLIRSKQFTPEQIRVMFPDVALPVVGIEA